MDTWQALKRIRQDLVSETESTAIVPDILTVQPLSRLEEFLRSKDASQNIQCLNAHVMERKIEALCQVERLNSGDNIFEYWQEKKSEDNALYVLSQTVLAVPSSQVSVERAFSALGLVLTQKRTHISETNLNNVLIVKLNNELFEKVSFAE